MPSTLTTIGNYAFSSCNSLEEIVIPSSVTAFGNYLLNNSSLKRIICKSELPVPIAATVFDDISAPANVTLYVPSQTAVDAYRANQSWNIFGTITVGFPTSVTSPDLDKVEVLTSDGYIFVKSDSILPSIELLSISGQSISKYSNKRSVEIDMQNNAFAILKVQLANGQTKAIKVSSTRR